MPRKKSYLTGTDQFCGCGGSSQGARRLAKKLKGGLEIALALNHWKLAIETHQTNFPETTHHCTDIQACDPRWYPSTDFLITSPECTNHSLSKGKKAVKATMDMFSTGELDPTAERSRATMWDVPRFAEYHDYNLIIVENVVDARKWVMWDAWIMAMTALGYNYECVYRNSQHHHPTPQSRDRLYVVFWKKGNKAPDLSYTPEGYCHKCAKVVNAVQTWKNPGFKWGRYKRQYIYSCPTCAKEVEPYYYAAFNVIDWSDRGRRIGDRLSPNTRRRVQFGIDTYGDEPMIITTKYSSGTSCRVRPMSTDILPTLTSEQGHAMLVPNMLIKNYGGTFDPKHASKHVGKPIDTITTHDHHALLSIPFIIKMEHSRVNNLKTVFDPFQTQTTRQSEAVIMPFIAELKGTGKARSTKSPLACVTTVSYHAIVTEDKWQSFIDNEKSNPISIYNPLRTQTTISQAALISYKKPNIEDCHYRMLKPHEIKLGMAFDEDYIVLGTGRDQVKQCGNAVTPPVMGWLLERGLATFN